MEEVKKDETSTTTVEAKETQTEKPLSENMARIAERKGLIVQDGKLVEKREEKKVEEKKEEKVEEKKLDNVSATPILITEEMIKDYPHLKVHLGRPLNDVFSASASLVRTWNRDRQELAELKKVKETKIIEEKLPTLAEYVQKGLDAAKIEIPDPVDDKKGFDEAVTKRAIKRQELIDEYQEKKSAPEKAEKEKQVETERLNAQTQDLATLFTAKIPGKTIEEIEALASEYMGEIKDQLERYPNLYKGKPELLASDLAAFALKKELAQERADREAKIAEGKKAETERIKAGMKEQSKQKPSNSVTAQDKPKESDSMKKIRERAEARYPKLELKE